jgi:hypothetical protein
MATAKCSIKYMSIENTNLSFGDALSHLKQGRRIARNGWNGKGMYVYLNMGSFDGTTLNITNDDLELQRASGKEHPSSIAGVSLSYFNVGDVGTICRLPNINMKDAYGNTVTGWLASQTDMLANDWEVLTN